MAKIYINADGMADLKKKLRNLSERIHSLESDIMRSIGQLDWEVSSKESIKEQIVMARREASILADKSSQMSMIIEKVINDFTAIDHSCANKQREATRLLEKVLKGVLAIHSRTFNEVANLGLKIIAAFEKARSLFLNEPEGIKQTNTLVLKKSIGNNSIDVQNITHSPINASVRKRLNIITKPIAKPIPIPPFAGNISYHPNIYYKNTEKIQKRLNELGYKGKDGKPLVADGYFGRNTLYAVNLFKSNNKIINRGKDNGIVDNKTWTSMFLSTAIGVSPALNPISSKNTNKVTSNISSTHTTKDTGKETTKNISGEITKDTKKVSPKVSFGGKMISQHSAEILTDILREAGMKKVIITSTVRSPHDQARIMYNNIIKKGSDYSHDLYASAGDQVVSVYDKLKGTKTKNEIIKAMEDKIIEVGPSKVSKHCGDPNKLEVIDIAPTSVSNKKEFIEAVKKAMANGKISKFIQPPKDPAYHIEIPQ